MKRKPSEQAREKMRANNAHFWSGKKRSQSTRDKISKSLMGRKRPDVSKALRGIKRSAEFKARVSAFQAIRYHTPEERHKQSLSKVGSKNPMYQSKKWVGKIHKLESRIKMSCSKRKIPLSEWRGFTEYKRCKHYRNTKYIAWRKQIFKRDNYTCQNCEKTNTFLHPHHIKSYTKYPELRYIVANGKTLCVKCHKDYHFKKGGK